MITEDVSIAEGKLEQILAVAFAPVVALTELIKNASDACINKNDIILINIDTKHNSIKIKDYGYGFSKSDIKALATIGLSRKMVGQNMLSAIGEPYAGSKGLGFLTAFNLCDKLEVNTYSNVDKCGYKISWVKGSSKITYEERDIEHIGTEIILYGVSEETIFLLTQNDELTKLYLSSITYYTENNNLPQIELYKDGMKLSFFSKEKIESLYARNKKKNSKIGYFIAKGSFKYSRDKLTLAYEDNILHLFDFVDEELDLNDYNSLLSFAKRNRIHIPRLRRWHEELLRLGPEIDDFEGVYYVWRDKKDTSVAYPPYGVRIYVNNYGMYNYLDKNNDWLQHGEISQNVKFTNYKPKNTFGYVNFKYFNEGVSKLKISQERNDFYVNRAQKKFMHIMRCFVSGIFSQIDITIKNYVPDDSVYFEQKADIRAIEQGQQLKIGDFIRTNLHQGQYDIAHSDGITIEENGTIIILSPGEYNISFGYNEEAFSCKIVVREKTPDFKLKKSLIKIDEGNSVNLRELISVSSLKHIDLHGINISCSDADVQRDIFTGKNPHGEYTVTYSNENIVPVSKTLQIIVRQTFQSESKNLKKLFPSYQSSEVPVKIQEIISGISDAYMRYPILCMIVFRTLIEICLREFCNKYDNQQRENFDEVEKGLLARFDVALTMAFAPTSTVPIELQNKYRNSLSGSARRKLRKHLEDLDLNTYVHNPAVLETSTEVLTTIKAFKMFLNFIIDSLAA